MKILNSKCGFHCNRCPAYIGNAGSEADRQRAGERWKKYFGLHFSPSVIRCEGCQASQPWKNGNLLPDRMCFVRTCALYNDVQTCAHCSLFPCREYLAKTPGESLREQRETAAGTAFTESEYLDNIEPFEGQPHLKHLRSTLSLSEVKEPRPFVSQSELVSLPKKLTLKSGQVGSLARLHLLLSRVFSEQAANYAGQLLLERKKPYIWGLLWSLAFHGRLRKGKLFLESEICGNIKECSRLVRKTDNRLHAAIKDAADILMRHGFKISFTPINKGWLLVLECDDSAGGEPVIEALRNYASTLVEKHGKPVYVDGFKLRGKAFKLFTRLDMRDL